MAESDITKSATKGGTKRKRLFRRKSHKESKDSVKNSGDALKVKPNGKVLKRSFKRKGKQFKKGKKVVKNTDKSNGKSKEVPKVVKRSEFNLDEAEDLLDVFMESAEFMSVEDKLDEDENGSDVEMETSNKKLNQTEKKVVKSKPANKPKETGEVRMQTWLEGAEERLDMSQWLPLGVSEPIRYALESDGFTTPTAIQAEVLPVAINMQLDVFGAAETGSGKTLAFVAPILENLLRSREESAPVDFAQRKLFALVLAPTRELVLQINNQFKKFAKFTDFRSVAIVGGLSEERQERLLNGKPEVIIATPGRFWSWCTKSSYAGDFTGLKNVVVDEIDRMLEKGHFRELVDILEKVHSHKTNKLQTLVFSATLTFIVLPDATKAQQSREAKLREIAKTTQMRKNYRVVDLTNEFATPNQLKERKVICQNLLEKDSKLYYILLTHPARTLVFTNSIDASQRLYSILTKLQSKPGPLLLHAKMQERNRLKNLDRFKNTPNSVLIATDVAARGLDIQGIENVVHYQIPRTAEDYVHRSGRTARALQKGMSIMLLDPQDVQRYKKICKSLHRENELESLEMDNQRRVDAIKQRCYLASEIEKLEYQLRKVSSAVNWKRRMAKEADLELSDDGESGPESDEANKRRLKKSAEKSLRAALAQPLPKSDLV